jgi:phage shock protein PspC (stress-responsive transcriptional regulator)
MTSAPPPAAPPPVPPSLDPPAWEPPPPPPGPPVRPQLRRSRTDKILGGVSGGLAEYSGIDALLWRVGFVALTLAGGTGVIVYLLLWLLMPAGPPALGAAAEQPAKEPAGPRSPVPGLTIAALLIVVGLLALITRLSSWDPGPRGFLGAALLVVGAGLVAAAFTGGRTARGGLIALGIVLSFALITATSAPWSRGVHGGGDRVYLPATAADVRSQYHGEIGDMTIDLSQIDVSNLDRPIRTRIDAGLGDLTIDVPADADVRVDVESGIGSVRLFGQDGRADGYFAGSGTGSWVGDGNPEIVLSVNAGIGDVEVDRG